MSFLPTGNHAGLLAGIWLTSDITPTLFLLYRLTACNVAGQTKRPISLVIVSAAFSGGSIIAPQTFQVKDAPQFTPAEVTSLASQVAGAFVMTSLFCYYFMANRRRDQSGASLQGQRIDEFERHLWEDLTDKQNHTFQYVY